MPEAFKLRNLLKVLNALGFQEIRQKGSHVFFEHKDGRTTLVPMHKEIHIRLLNKIVKQDLKMDKKEFFKLLEEM